MRGSPAQVARHLFNIPDDEVIWLVVVYAKAEYDNLPSRVLNQLRW